MRLYGLLASIVLFCSCAAAETVTIAADDYCPYHCRPGAGAARTGFVVDIVNEVFSEQGIAVAFEQRPWQRGLLEVKDGALSAVMLATRGEAAGLLIPAIEQGRAQTCFYSLTKSKWTYENELSLETVRLGLIKGYEYVEPVNSYINQERNAKRIEFIAGKTPLQRLFEMMQRNRIDAIFDDAIVVNYLLQQLAIKDQFKQAGCAEEKIDLFVAFSARNTESVRYTQLLSKGMSAMRRDGRLEKILEKYGVTDWRQ